MKLQISLEELTVLVVQKVIGELNRHGVDVSYLPIVDSSISGPSSQPKRVLEINMSEYKTPVLAKNHFQSIEPDIVEIIIPEKTVITQGARDMIKKKKLTVTYKTN